MRVSGSGLSGDPGRCIHGSGLGLTFDAPKEVPFSGGGITCSSHTFVQVAGTSASDLIIDLHQLC